MTDDISTIAAPGRQRAIRLTAVIGLAGIALSACVSEPRYPVRTATAPAPVPARPQPAPPPATAPASPDTPAARPSTPVQSQDLPPIGASARVTMAAPPPGTAPPPVAAAPVRPGAAVPPAPAAPATPQILEVTVASGESLFDVAERTRTPVRALIEINGLQPPYVLTPGTRLRAPQPLVYQVAPGDTLFGVARRFNIDPRSLATLNDMTLETGLKVGQTVQLPALARDQGSIANATGPTPAGMAMGLAAAPARPAPTPSTPTQTARGPSASPSVPLATLPPPAPAVATVSDQEVAAAGRGKFLWPVRGDILSGYGAKGPGQRNDGLNIAAKAGDPVKAAAAGEVVFAGALPGFGNLVLLKHPGGWVTAYAHLSKMAVKMRDNVSQGQSVGEVGQTGGTVDQPQLHFEIRYASNPREKARPIDPTIILPG